MCHQVCLSLSAAVSVVMLRQPCWNQGDILVQSIVRRLRTTARTVILPFDSCLNCWARLPRPGWYAGFRGPSRPELQTTTFGTEVNPANPTR